MVTHRTATAFETSWSEWRSLLAACESYAQLQGWRFVKADFMNLGADLTAAVDGGAE